MTCLCCKVVSLENSFLGNPIAQWLARLTSEREGPNHGYTHGKNQEYHPSVDLGFGK
jgi:hypothetical protein